MNKLKVCCKCSHLVASENGRVYARCPKHLADQRRSAKRERSVQKSAAIHGFAVARLTAGEKLALARVKYREAIEDALLDLGETP